MQSTPTTNKPLSALPARRQQIRREQERDVALLA
jgi:hypothetical protein